MKRIIAPVIALALALVSLAGCQIKGGGSNGPCCFSDPFSSSAPANAPSPPETGPPAPPPGAPQLPAPVIDASPRAPDGKKPFMGTSTTGIIPGSCQFFLLGSIGSPSPTGDTGLGAGHGVVIGGVYGGCLLEEPSSITVTIKVQKRNADGQWENQGPVFPSKVKPPQWPLGHRYMDWAPCIPGLWRFIGNIIGVTSVGKPFLDSNTSVEVAVTAADCRQ